MISVMNTNNFELDHKSDAVEDKPRTKPRVSEEEVDSSDKGTNGGGGVKGESVNLIGSEDIRVLDGDNEKIRDSMELGNPAPKSEKVRVSGGDVGAVDNRRSEGVRASDLDRKGTNEEMESRPCESNNKDDEFSSRYHGTKQMESRIREIGNGVTVKNSKIEPLGSKAGKGLIEVGKSPASQYDSMLSMFDEFAANGGGGAMVVVSSKSVGYGYEIGDMVWGKVKSHPWWPGHIYSEEFASPSVRRSKREGHVLVAFFGDSSYGWFDPAELVPFDSNFAEKSRQINSRTFIKAVEEAVDEASRRRGLGLACRCRNAYNFRSTNVQGYFAVDVADYEPGAVYSTAQIKKARDGFQPRATLAFIKQLALAPTSSEHGGFHFIQNKATVFAYRKAVFEEFDETYAQAFGYQPVRPSPGPVHELAPRKMPSRAPLSGRLVIAETLGKGKSSGKPNKAKDQAKKDKYHFKWRDDPDELKTHQTNEGQATSSPQPVYVEGSLAIASGDYVLQKRAPAVSTKPQIPAKHEVTGTTAGDVVSAFGAATGRDVSVEDNKPTVFRYSNPGFEVNARSVESPASSSAAEAPPGYSSHLIEVSSSCDKKGVVLEMGDLGDYNPRTAEPGKGTVPFHDDIKNSRAVKVVEGFEQTPCQPATVVMHREDQVQDVRSDTGAKKVKVQKRSVGEISTDKTVLAEKKKKRKKELVKSDSTQLRAKDGVAVAGKVAAPDNLFQVGQLRTDVRTSTSSSDAVVTQQIAGIGNMELELPQLLCGLQALALDPFHGVERRRPGIVRQVFLRFRSLVYEKSLPLSPPAEDEGNDSRASKPPAENARELPPVKPQARLSVRPDDPTKGGRKRGPSDRQEEMAAKKKKKVNDMKNITAEKKAPQKTPEAAARDSKQTVSSMPRKVGPESSIKKTLQPPSQASEPMMLIMKFPQTGPLPSINELKAKLARFGQLDHSGTRIFGKTFTCRVVYKHKADAVAAYKVVAGHNGLFRTDVKCHLRDVGGVGSESEPVKVQKEDASTGVQQSVEQRPSAAVAPTTLGVQLKSCLKKSGGEEATGGNGGNGRGTPRVKFMLGGEESNRGEEQLMMIGSKNNYNNNNASFADGGASSSSSSHATMDFYSKNFQKGILQPTPLPILPLPTNFTAQFTRPPHTLHYSTEVAPPPPPPPPQPQLQPQPQPQQPRNALHNFNTTIISPHPTSNVDIAPQMLSLLTKCNDVVNNLTGFLGYVPYHPL